MRIRNVKPGFYRSDDIDALSWEERFLFIALFSYVDDNGVGRDREVDVCADLFAGDFSVDPTETLGKVRQCLLALVRQGLVLRYEVDGKRFLFITGWDDHQYVKNPNPVRYPRPDKALLQVSVVSGESRSNVSVEPELDLPPVVGSRSCVVGSKDRAAADATAEFERFWSLYPKKVNKKRAHEKWKIAAKTEDPSVIIAAVERYVRFLNLPNQWQKPKDPDGWLTGEKWNDQLDGLSADGAARPKRDALGFLVAS